MSHSGETFNPKSKRNLCGIILAVLLVLADQYTKFLAAERLAEQESISVIPGILRLQYLENRGAAFSFLEGRIPVLVLFSAAILAFVFYVIVKAPARHFYDPLCFTCFLLTAGAVGNMIDRVFRGYVIDFIYFQVIDFPIFNLADIYTCAAGFLIIVLSFFYYKGEHDFDFLIPNK